MSKTLAEIFAKPPTVPASDRELQLETALAAVIRGYDRLIGPLATKMGEEIPLFRAVSDARRLVAVAPPGTEARAS